MGKRGVPISLEGTVCPFVEAYYMYDFDHKLNILSHNKSQYY